MGDKFGIFLARSFLLAVATMGIILFYMVLKMSLAGL